MYKRMTQKLYCIIAMLCVLAGMSSTAQAASRTVTYTFTVESDKSNVNRHTLTFVPSSNGFNYSTGEKTVTIPNTTSTKGFTVNLDDGLMLTYSQDEGHLTFFNYNGFGLNWTNDGGNSQLKLTSTHYYVTHVKMATTSGNPLTGQASPWMTASGQLDQDVDMTTQYDGPQDCRSFSATSFSASQVFGQLTVTYGDPRDYAITYNNAVNGQNGVTNTNATSYNVTTNEVRITAPTRTGYTFSGFTYTDAAHPSATAASLPMGINRGEAATRKAITFNATWTAHTYTLRLHHNDGTDGFDDVAMTYDVPQTLPDLPRTDYVLNGWNTQSDGNGTSFIEGQSVSNLTAVNGATVDLYAQWTTIEYVPLTLCAIAAGNITVTDPKDGMQYSKNRGTKTDVTASAISVSAGDIIQFYGKGTSITSYYGTRIQCSADCYIYGNIMSLVDETGFATNTTLTEKDCFRSLFNSNTHLKNHSDKALVLPAMTLASKCYQEMFYGCTSLTTAPALPATTLAEFCYQSMFHECSGLTTAPVLPATTLASTCYDKMFYGCANLTTPPALPATTLANNCYQGMFQHCAKLSAAPVLPATTLANNCYQGMFQNCDHLNYLICLATNVSGSIYTQNWLKDVAGSGTFVRAAGASWGSDSGVNGIPTGWTTVEALRDDADNSTGITALNDDPTLNGQKHDVMLYGRTLYRDGDWNTLCLPFDIDDISTSTLAGATIMELDTKNEYTGHKTSFDAGSGTLYLYFQEVDKIKAGAPYLIKWASGSNIADPTFDNVEIKGSSPKIVTSSDSKVSFIGNYDPVSIGAGGDNTKLYIGTGDHVYYPNDAMSINSFRAYFQLNGITAQQVAGTRVMFGGEDDGTTGIVDNKRETINNNQWYTLEGRKLPGKPTAKGLYIVNGRLVVVK